MTVIDIFMGTLHILIMLMALATTNMIICGLFPYQMLHQSPSISHSTTGSAKLFLMNSFPFTISGGPTPHPLEQGWGISALVSATSMPLPPQTLKHLHPAWVLVGLPVLRGPCRTVWPLLVLFLMRLPFLFGLFSVICKMKTNIVFIS